MTSRYLGVSGIARHLGVSRHAVSKWRERYPADSAHPFPASDVEIDGVPGWSRARLPVIEDWRKALPGRGAGGGRPRQDAKPTEPDAVPVPIRAANVSRILRAGGYQVGRHGLKYQGMTVSQWDTDTALVRLVYDYTEPRIGDIAQEAAQSLRDAGYQTVVEILNPGLYATISVQRVSRTG